MLYLDNDVLVGQDSPLIILLFDTSGCEEGHECLPRNACDHFQDLVTTILSSAASEEAKEEAKAKLSNFNSCGPGESNVCCPAGGHGKNFSNWEQFILTLTELKHVSQLHSGQFLAHNKMLIFVGTYYGTTYVL